jgi:hypothetical protein
MRFANGASYKGEWSRDVFHGEGIYIFNTQQ